MLSIRECIKGSTSSRLKTSILNRPGDVYKLHQVLSKRPACHPQCSAGVVLLLAWCVWCDGRLLEPWRVFRRRGLDGVCRGRRLGMLVGDPSW